ncbi:MAG: permease-like cell division protein FtsX [Pseudomonadota bacterium]
MKLIREAVKDAVRHRATSTMMVVVIAVSIFIISLFTSVIYNLGVIENKWSQKVSVSVFLTDGADNEAVLKSIKTVNGVLSVTYFDQQKSLDVLKKRFPNEDIMFSSSAVPAFIEVKTSAGEVERIKTEIKNVAGIDDVVSNTIWFDSLKKLLSVVSYVSMVVIFLVSIMSLLLISYAARIGILERKYEINIMRLCGATEWKLRLPHITSGIIMGAIGGIMGVVLYLILKSLLENTITYFIDSWQADEPYQLAAVLCLAVFLGAAGNLVAFIRGTNEAEE